MNELTSFIVLEDASQELALMKKQKEILNSKYPEDIGDLEVMDEPSILIISIIILIIILSTTFYFQGNIFYYNR